jgi:hypothetical protein
MTELEIPDEAYDLMREHVPGTWQVASALGGLERAARLVVATELERLATAIAEESFEANTPGADDFSEDYADGTDDATMALRARARELRGA